MGNQLFPIKTIDKDFDEIFMAEDYDLCAKPKQHKLKILFFLSSMRSYRDELLKSYKINYIDINHESFKDSYLCKLKNIIEKRNIKKINFYEIEDLPFANKLYKFLDKEKIPYSTIESPMFVTSRMQFKSDISGMKKPKMASFYIKQRERMNILLTNSGKPIGGKWSFDKENRKKIPKSLEIPKINRIKDSENTNVLKKQIDEKFKNHIGDVNEFWLPTTRKDALTWLNDFIKIRLNKFGDYEDAVDDRSHVLFHSVLSPMLNCGIITPEEIIDKVKNIKTPINSIEGFIRQIIGWREFMRGIYQNYHKEFKENNFFKHDNKMNKNWYTGDTGLFPLDYSIKRAIKYSWASHIERLMIQANIMNLCQIKPSCVYKWFMEMYTDSSEWVMYPNVYGMGIFSDGGIFATKPYLCGSNYFLKMMDFKKGEWCDTLDGLYWRFIEKNQKYFSGNPRLSMMTLMLKRIDKKRKERIFKLANNFIKSNTA